MDILSFEHLTNDEAHLVEDELAHVFSGLVTNMVELRDQFMELDDEDENYCEVENTYEGYRDAVNVFFKLGYPITIVDYIVVHNRLMSLFMDSCEPGRSRDRIYSDAISEVCGKIEDVLGKHSRV